MRNYLAIKDWTTTFNYPIIVSKGDKILIDLLKKEDNPDWQGWFWCTFREAEGWIPEQIVDVIESNTISAGAVVIESYSAQELNVKTGENVLGEKILNGWLWCKKEGEETYGWLPLSVLEELQ